MKFMSIIPRGLFPNCVKPSLNANAAKVCATGANGESEGIIDNCAIRLFGKFSLACVDIPKCTNPLLLAVLGICFTKLQAKLNWQNPN